MRFKNENESELLSATHDYPDSLPAKTTAFRPTIPPVHDLLATEVPLYKYTPIKDASSSEDQIVKRRQNLIAVRAGPEARVLHRLLRVLARLDGGVVRAADVDELVADAVRDDVAGMR